MITLSSANDGDYIAVDWSPDNARIAAAREDGTVHLWSVPETATALGVSPSTIDRQWACARAWLFREITAGK